MVLSIDEVIQVLNGLDTVVKNCIKTINKEILMLGLRTVESQSFLNYFKLVQAKASEYDKVFFLDFGQGEDLIIGDMEVDTLFGWLIPKENVDEFNKDFLMNYDLSRWEDYNVWVIADIDCEGVKVSFD